MKTLEERFWEKVEKTATCWLWQSALLWNGYGQIDVDGQTVRAHRIAWELTHGPISAGMQVLHSCDTRSCVNPDHLFLGTTQDNTADKVSKQRQSRGTGHGRAVFNEAQVLDIRSKSAVGTHTYKQLAAEYDCTESAISHIVKRRTWKHI